MCFCTSLVRFLIRQQLVRKYHMLVYVLKKITTELSKKNSFCCILYCKAHKGCLKTEIYVLLHRLKKMYRKSTSCDAELKT